MWSTEEPIRETFKGYYGDLSSPYKEDKMSEEFFIIKKIKDEDIEQPVTGSRKILIHAHLDDLIPKERLRYDKPKKGEKFLGMINDNSVCIGWIDINEGIPRTRLILDPAPELVDKWDDWEDRRPNHAILPTWNEYIDAMLGWLMNRPKRD